MKDSKNLSEVKISKIQRSYLRWIIFIIIHYFFNVKMIFLEKGNKIGEKRK